MPNPESALNEEAGRLLLEQYNDYAKRARLYTSIQAKSGKSQYMELHEERKKKKGNDEEKVLIENDEQHALKSLTNQKRVLEQDNEKKKVMKKRMLRRL